LLQSEKKRNGDTGRIGYVPAQKMQKIQTKTHEADSRRTLNNGN
jgi:hypothetical protein